MTQPGEGQSINPEALSAQVQSLKQTLALHQEGMGQLRAVSNDVLDSSKLAAGKFQLSLSPTDPKKIIEDTAKLFHDPINKKKLKVRFEFPLEKITLNIDPVRLKQILMNLLSNSLKFTPEHGRIVIALDEPVIGATHTSLKFSMSDTGPGMTKEHMAHIFSPYTQANEHIANQYRGSGLGLSISKDLAELMGGSMTCRSEEGVGTTFICTIRCPNELKIAPDVGKPLIFSTPKPSPSQGKRILIVDDDIKVQKAAKKYLEQVGYHCAVANNGQEAVELCETNHFHAVLMDLDMPVMGGIEATSQFVKMRVTRQAGSIHLLLPYQICRYNRI